MPFERINPYKLQKSFNSGTSDLFFAQVQMNVVQKFSDTAKNSTYFKISHLLYTYIIHISCASNIHNTIIAALIHYCVMIILATLWWSNESGRDRRGVLVEKLRPSRERSIFQVG